MNEDDTFRILKRIPIKEMIVKVIAEYMESKVYSAYLIPDEFYEKHGWTREDYITKTNYT
jgi:hypothetical protein